MAEIGSKPIWGGSSVVEQHPFKVNVVGPIPTRPTCDNIITMQKFRTFSYVFVKSLTSPSYYTDILKTKFSFSLKYLAFLFLILSIISTVNFGLSTWKYVQQAPEFITKSKDFLKDFYPKELTVNIKDGQVATNVTEPYFIDLPSVFTNHFITIDTKAGIDEFTKYKTMVLVTKTAILYQDDKGNKFYPLTEVKGPVTINQALYLDYYYKALPYLNSLPTLANVAFWAGMVLLPFIMAWASLVSKLIYLLLASVLVLLLAKIMKKQLSYGQIYRLCMHGLTLSILVSTVFSFPFLSTIILLVWMAIVFKRLA